MDSYTDKGKDKGEYEDTDAPTIRIILKSQEVKNLQYVSKVTGVITLGIGGYLFFDAIKVLLGT